MAKLIKTKGQVKKNLLIERLKLLDHIEKYDIGDKVICDISNIEETIFTVIKQTADIEHYVVKGRGNTKATVHWKNMWLYENEVVDIIGSLM